MVATANTVMRGGVTTVTSTPTSPTDTTASRASVISSTVSVSFQPSSRGARACGSSAAPHLERQFQPSRSTQPSARAFSAYLAPPHARACGSSAAPHLENQAEPSFRAFEKSDRRVVQQDLPELTAEGRLALRRKSRRMPANLAELR